MATARASEASAGWGAAARPSWRRTISDLLLAARAAPATVRFTFAGEYSADTAGGGGQGDGQARLMAMADFTFLEIKAPTYEGGDGGG
jgi:hypothetical protein